MSKENDLPKWAQASKTLASSHSKVIQRQNISKEAVCRAFPNSRRSGCRTRGGGEMKTTKEQRKMLREVYARSREMGPTINPPPVLVDLIDDLDSLESRCARQAELLKTAKCFATEMERDFSHSEYCEYDESWEDEVEENRNVDECWKCALHVWLASLSGKAVG